MNDTKNLQSQVSEYIKIHKIDSLMKEMMHSVIKSKPEKPINSMISYLINGLSDYELERAGIIVDRSKLEIIEPKPLVKDFYFSEHSSLIIKRFLTPTVFDKLRLVKTKFGGTLGHLIDVANKVEGKETVGIFATDNDCYSLMKSLFTPALDFLHAYDPEKALFSYNYDIGLNKFKLDNEDFLGFKLRINRNLSGFPYNPHASSYTRKTVEDKILALVQKNFPEGKYYSLGDKEFNLLKDQIFDKELNLISAGCK